MNSEEPNENLLNYETPPVPTISESRRMAAGISKGLGVLTILAGLCTGTMAGLILSSTTGAGFLNFVIAGGVAFVPIVTGTVYLIGGYHIRRGSEGWIVAILILAICHEIATVLGIFIRIDGMPDAASLHLFLFLWKVFFAGTLLFLIMNLSQARKELRP